MNTLFQVVTLPLKAIWDAICSIVIDSGVTLAALILSGVMMAVLIGVVTHISISGSHTKGLIEKHERN